MFAGLLGLLACQVASDIQADNTGKCPDDGTARIAINPHSATLHVRDSLSLMASIPKCLDVGPQTFTWESRDTTVASVNPNSGVILGVRPGTTTIMARALPDSTIIAPGEIAVLVTP